jgi:hypothetical protein
MSEAYLRRLVIAAHGLAAADASIRQLLAGVDWGTCETPEETDYETLSCLRQDSSSDPDPFSSKPICGACQTNRDTLKQVRTMRKKRYLAMLRVVRLSAHVGHP